MSPLVGRQLQLKVSLPPGPHADLREPCWEPDGLAWHAMGLQRPPVGRLRAGGAASVVTRLDQAGLVGEDDGLGPVAEAELGKKVGEVRLHRRFTEEQRAGDLLV
jgi:hypothetical protein